MVVNKRVLNEVIQYTNRDFDQVVEELKSVVEVSDKPQTWNDFFLSNIGIFLTDQIAYEAQKNTYMANMIAQEIFIATMRRRASALKHAKFAGYQPRGRLDTIIDIQAQELPAVSGNVGTLLEFAEGSNINVGSLAFQIMETRQYLITETLTDMTHTPPKIAYTNPTDPTKPQIIFPVYHSQKGEDEFIYERDLARTYTTSEGEVIDHSWTVTVGGGLPATVWHDVRDVDTILSLYFADEDDEVYQAEYLADGRLRIKFGDGVRGKQPAPGTAVTLAYRYGGGVEGAVVLPNTMSGQMIQATLGGQSTRIPFDNPHAVAATSTATPQAGQDEETVAEMRWKIPQYIRTVDKAISEEDYETLAAQFVDNEGSTGAVARAVVQLTRTGYTANWVYIYIWETATPAITWTVGDEVESGEDVTIPGFQAANTALMEALYRYLHERRVATVQVCINQGRVKQVDLDFGTVICDQYVSTGTVLTAIKTALATFFSSSAYVQPGRAVRLSDIYNLVDSIAGVDHFTIQSPTADVQPNETEVAVLRSVTLTLENLRPAGYPVGACDLEVASQLD